MEKINVLRSLSALAHEMRLDIFRHLVKAGPQGAAAGDIALALDVRANTLSNNLTILSAAGLVRSAREGRSIRYFAEMEGMRALLSYLMEDCCGGQAERCAPILAEIVCGC
ncbi:metalloregulator ArsR/SmtB family transcription factor [Breoghania sp.]|uniref:ArsR/SmtB family transcription factor n=1 Tax=Breoghania sp. TaxID=2065378 RepID=UPI002AA88B21|nr:metalloregulator ArsR/SmtB family transcription factor [Breoghania sp.]